MGLFHARRLRPIVFTFAPQYAGSGTSVMRGGQLSQLLAASGSTDRPVSFQAFSRRFKHSDLFLTKGVLKTVTPDELAHSSRRGNRIFVDPVDEDLSDEMVEQADVVVAASRTAEDAYQARWTSARVVLLNHHVDPRVDAALTLADRGEFDDARAAYFGELENTVQTPDIAKIVDFVAIDTSRQDERWLSRLAPYNLHYAIRRTRALDRYKPFLKGFTAAACDANIVIQSTETEAARWLPADYPYWHHGEVTEKSILATLHNAREGFGGPDWLYAREAMNEIARQTSPSAIASDAARLFD